MTNVVAHTQHLRQRLADLCEFKAGLVYIMRYRAAMAAQ
jgi:hypothetical protein